MRSLASITLLGTLTLLSLSAQAQMRGGGGGGMRGGGGSSFSGGGMRSGGSFSGGGVRMSSPAPRFSGGRSFSSAPAGQVFRGAPAFRTRGVPVNNFNRQNGTVFTTRNTFFNSRLQHFNSPFFHNHNHIFFNHAFFHHGFFGANCFGTFAFGNPFCFGNSAFFFGSPFFSLGYGYPGYGYGYGYDPGYYSSDNYPQQAASSNDNGNEVALTAEIQRLSDAIDDLRDDRNNSQRNFNQDDQQSPSANGLLSAVPPAGNTIFILRDGRRIAAQNYAISGQTLWILNEHSARKTPLADIDRDATEKANAANGIEIHLPEPVSPK